MAKTQCRLVEELGWVFRIIYCHGHNSLFYSFAILTLEIKYVCNLVMLRLIIFPFVFFLDNKVLASGKGSAFCVVNFLFRSKCIRYSCWTFLYLLF